MTEPHTFERGDLVFTFAPKIESRSRNGSIKIKKESQDYIIETPSYILHSRTGIPDCLTPDLLSKIDIDAVGINIRDV